jgi:cellulose biosynthesis protein BcsQ
MNVDRTAAVPVSSARFDALRARLEVDLVRPAVVAITASSETDGKEIAARGLAFSLATAGYRTLLIDTSPTHRGRSRIAPDTPLEEIVRQQASTQAASGSGIPAVLVLSDAYLQRTVSQRSLQSALATLRDAYDFVIFNTEFNIASPFTTGIFAGADAVVATVRTGRRATAADERLAVSLGRIGARFLGVVALEAAVIRDETVRTVPSVAESYSDVSRTTVSDGERPRRKTIESPT